MTPKESASHTCELQDKYPSHYDDKKPTDWAHDCAQTILVNLLDRRGIKNELRQCEPDIKADIVEALAEIIRLKAGRALATA